MKLKFIISSLFFFLTSSAVAESMSDIIMERQRESEKSKPVAQVMEDPSINRKGEPPPRLVALRGVDGNIIATFEFDGHGAFETSMRSTELPGGWKLISIEPGRARISHGKDKPVTVFLTGRVGSTLPSRDIPPPPPSPF